MKVLGPMDAVWLYLESADTPMHFAMLMTFLPPEKSPRTFIDRLAKSLIETSDVQSPWNLRLPRGPLGRYQPVLQVDPAPQLDHHVRRATVPAPAGHDELLALVADLHATGLDMSRPLWECHLIDGLSNGRFAIYLKIHHALLDGTSAMRLVMDMLSESPNARRSPPVWAIPPASRNVGSGAAPIWRIAEGAARRAREPGNLTRGRDAAKAAAKLARAIVHTASAAADPTDPLAAPFTGSPTPFGGRVTARRTLATRALELAEVKKVARASGCTVNDLVLYLVASSLRRFLVEADHLPAQPLTAAVPVNVRETGDDRVGNAVAQLYVNLATDVADPQERLTAIRLSAAAGKTHLRSLPPAARTPFTLLMTGPYVMGLAAGLAGNAPVPYSLNISNVPGPTEPLYFNGARMDGFYPASFLMHGGKLCVLCTSYAGKLVLSLTAASDQLPQAPRIAELAVDAFNEIARVVAVPTTS